jgi:hypothetical protein
MNIVADIQELTGGGGITGTPAAGTWRQTTFIFSEKKKRKKGR